MKSQDTAMSEELDSVDDVEESSELSSVPDDDESPVPPSSTQFGQKSAHLCQQGYEILAVMLDSPELRSQIKKGREVQGLARGGGVSLEDPYELVVETVKAILLSLDLCASMNPEHPRKEELKGSREEFTRYFADRLPEMYALKRPRPILTCIPRLQASLDSIRELSPAPEYSKIGTFEESVVYRSKASADEPLSIIGLKVLDVSLRRREIRDYVSDCSRLRTILASRSSLWDHDDREAVGTAADLVSEAFEKGTRTRLTRSTTLSHQKNASRKLLWRVTEYLRKTAEDLNQQREPCGNYIQHLRELSECVRAEQSATLTRQGAVSSAQQPAKLPTPHEQPSHHQDFALQAKIIPFQQPTIPTQQQTFDMQQWLSYASTPLMHTPQSDVHSQEEIHWEVHPRVNSTGQTEQLTYVELESRRTAGLQEDEEPYPSGPLLQ